MHRSTTHVTLVIIIIWRIVSCFSMPSRTNENEANEFGTHTRGNIQSDGGVFKNGSPRNTDGSSYLSRRLLSDGDFSSDTTKTHSYLNGTILDTESDVISNAILLAVTKFLPLFVIPVGSVGNLLAFLVLGNGQYAKQTACFYMRMVAVFDTSCLLGHVTLQTIINFYPDYLFGPEAGRVVCKILPLFFSAYGPSNWTVVAMTFDRFLAVKFPLKIASWNSMRRSRITAACIVMLTLVVAIPFSIRDINTDGLVAQSICVFNPAYPSWFSGVWYKVHTVTIFTAPFCTILLLNLLIIGTLRLQSQNSSKLGKTNKDGHVTVLLILIILIFFVTNVPWTVFYWVDDYLDQLITTTSRISMIRKTVYETVNFVLYINPSANFYVYCLGCNKFREDVIAMFSCGRNAPANEKRSRASEMRH
ncbi:somatostatin receptor type 4-like [Lineus longissimus]|uniref:somatostatin receptor type 4-like n=1 Tax=Lineus longissimus TaxID=88925 RepID=UPI00315CF9B9